MAGYFPMFVSLEGKKILVVGCGTVGERRLRSLLPFGGNITVVSSSFPPAIREIEGLTLRERHFRDEDLEGVDLAVIATSDKAENERIAALCAQRGIIKNVASDEHLCDFRFPALVHTSDTVVGICSNDRNPTRTKQIRKEIQEFYHGQQED